MEFKDFWDFESAMKVLTHRTVDSKLWAEAVEWLILYGPEEIKKLLLESSTIATRSSFPDLQPSSYTIDGQPCYNLQDLAKALQIDETEARGILRQKEAEHGNLHIGDEPDKGSVH